MSVFAFEQLPLELQRSIEQGKPIQIIKENKPFTVLKNEPYQPSYAKGDFDYDLDRMKKAVEAPYVVVPRFDNNDDFFNWVENLSDDDFIAEKM